MIASNEKELICLGIESTAHTFGVGIASSSGKIVANINATYKPPSQGGIHPREAAQHHCDVAPNVLKKALQKSTKGTESLDAIAFSFGPASKSSLRIILFHLLFNELPMTGQKNSLFIIPNWFLTQLG